MRHPLPIKISVRLTRRKFPEQSMAVETIRLTLEFRVDTDTEDGRQEAHVLINNTVFARRLEGAATALLPPTLRQRVHVTTAA